MGLVDKLFGSYSAKELKRIRPQVDAVLALEDHYRQMDNKTLQGETARFKELLANGKNLDDILPEAFAACRPRAGHASLPRPGHGRHHPAPGPHRGNENR